jgi:G3E family GTPase
MDMADMRTTIPVHVIAGFLGSGKTTLLGRALDVYNGKGLRPVVIMNELGDVNLDGIAVDAAGGGDVPMAELLGGCICCTIRSDLSVQLSELVSEYGPDAIFIEATGVANPIEIMDAVTEASLYLPITLESIVTVVDGVHTADLLVKPKGKTLRLMRDQVRCASRILLNKVDRLASDRVGQVEQALREWNAYAPIERTVRCVADIESVFAAAAGPPRPPLSPDNREHICGEGCDHNHNAVSGHQAHPAHEHVSVYTHFFAGPVDSHAFEAFMKSLPDSVYRGKGIVSFTDTASRFLFQFAYRELDFTRIQPQGEVNDVAVLIGEQFPKTELAARLQELERESACR